jgi:ectoine hydroxylase-related dioxygenase (phytanoyl-CoA dioxygenase family)
MDIDANTGGQVLVMPGTHKLGAISVGDINEDFTEQITLSPKKGTVILIHGHLWHRVLPATGSHRASTNYRCCPAGVAADITDICVYRNMRYQFSSSSLIEERLP